ncbi:class I SAM-dependent methyltransferase [Asanoa iriomotensis]|uniref:Methyltransferase type 12 n=1 Tax=Asanoa iriomotensis TaxID=234613 RepID=A0ABQ4C1X3_9ACTN|nr:class I SAM-dependent methyltransferase [Asanoa iriomotensis]GIF56783.1 methyltransferase type 12 [Asanoa iriomotensis]
MTAVAFEPALRRRTGHWLVHGDGRRRRLPVGRWHGDLEPALVPVLARCAGPTIDLGCGPGRVAAALARRGVATLGVDISAHAVRLTRSRGVAAVRGDVLDPLPGEGNWAHALLLDGNVGIGGDPAALLRRCGRLVRGGGTVIVECEPPGAGVWRGEARLLRGKRSGPAFRWARVGVDATAALAADAGLHTGRPLAAGRRWFVEMRRP